MLKRVAVGPVLKSFARIAASEREFMGWLEAEEVIAMAELRDASSNRRSKQAAAQVLHTLNEFLRTADARLRNESSPETDGIAGSARENPRRPTV